MPIVVNLDIELAKRKMTLTEFARTVPVAMSNLSILRSNKARAVRFSTLHEICKALRCQPGDILQYMDDDEYERLFAHKWKGDFDDDLD